MAEAGDEGAPPTLEAADETGGSRESSITRSRSRKTPLRHLVKPVLNKDHRVAAREATREDYVVKMKEVTTEEEQAAAKKAGYYLHDFGHGVQMKLDRFPQYPKRGEKNSDYGVPVAVSLLLRICAEAAGLFFVMFLFALLSGHDNSQRSLDRLQCRVAGSTVDGHAILTNNSAYAWPGATYATRAEAYAAVASALGFPPEECGWSGLSIRLFNATDLTEAGVYQNNASDFPFYLRTGLGGCQEYRACDEGAPEKCDKAIFPFMRWFASAEQSRDRMLVDVPAARFCFGGEYKMDAGGTGDPAGMWSAAIDLLNLLLVIVFLVRIRWLSQRMAAHEDKMRITTADYSIEIGNLDTSIPPTELRQRLKDEIEGLSFKGQPNHFKGQIHHLDVGRTCRKEVKVMERIRTLEVFIHELMQRKTNKEGRGVTDHPKTDRLFAKAVPEYTKLCAEMKTLISTPDVSTGHAYVAFKHELTRNEFYLMFHTRSAAEPASKTYGSIEEGGAAPASTKLGKPPILDVASPTAKSAGALFAARDETWVDDLMDVVWFVLGFEKIDEKLTVTSAPEPREIDWKALELTDEHERRVVLRGRAVTWTLIVVGAFSLLLAKAAQFHYRLEVAPTLPAGEGFAGVAVAEWGGYGFMVLAVGVSVFFNTLIRQVTAYFVHEEGQDTHTQAEASSFNKLSIGLMTNTVVVPMGVSWFLSIGSDGTLVVGDQTWYEPGGFISQMMVLIICSWTTDLLIFCNIMPLVNKHCLSRFVYSDEKLEQLWKPMPYQIGSSYAVCLVLFAMGFIYGPLYPPAYLLVVFGFTIKYLCTRFGLRHWFAVPVSVDQEMMMTLRWRLGQALAFSLLVQSSAIATSAGPRNPWPVYFTAVGGSVALLLYTITPLGCFKSLRRFDQLATTTELDTGGLSFDDACAKRGLPMPHYICPTLAADGDTDDDHERLERARQAILLAKQHSADVEDIETSIGGKKTRGGYNLRYMHAARAEDAMATIEQALRDNGQQVPRAPAARLGSRKSAIEAISAASAAAAAELNVTPSDVHLEVHRRESASKGTIPVVEVALASPSPPKKEPSAGGVTTEEGAATVWT